MSKKQALLFGLAVAGLITLIAFMATGCASAYDAAQQSRSSLSKALDESTQAWKQYDHAKQIHLAEEAATKEAAEAALIAYREGEQAKAIRAINGTWAAMVGLDRALAAWNAGERGGLSAALSNAFSSLSEVVRALSAVGIPIPGGGR